MSFFMKTNEAVLVLVLIGLTMKSCNAQPQMCYKGSLANPEKVVCNKNQTACLKTIKETKLGTSGYKKVIKYDGCAWAKKPACVVNKGAHLGEKFKHKYCYCQKRLCIPVISSSPPTRNPGKGMVTSVLAAIGAILYHRF